MILSFELTQENVDGVGVAWQVKARQNKQDIVGSGMKVVTDHGEGFLVKPINTKIDEAHSIHTIGLFPLGTRQPFPPWWSFRYVNGEHSAKIMVDTSIDKVHIKAL